MSSPAADRVATADLLDSAVGRLTAAGVDSAGWDAAQLLAHVTGRSRSELVTTTAVSEAQAAEFRRLVERRADRVPLQHLVGSVGFRYIDVAVGPGVFIPRPETEVVVGFTLAAVREAGPRPVVVDLCSGSGVIPLALANEWPAADVHAVENDAGALEWLRRNARDRVAAGDRPIHVHEADAAQALPALAGAVDVVVSNPPYVAEDELAAVAPEVRDHDPRTALVAGGDGLDVIRAVIATAERLLRPGGFFVVEHSDRQGEACPALLTGRTGWTEVADHPDLTGRPRCTTARWKG